MHCCVGHTARAAKGREGRCQAGPKGCYLEVGPCRAPKTSIFFNILMEFFLDTHYLIISKYILIFGGGGGLSLYQSINSSFLKGILNPRVKMAVINRVKMETFMT